MEKENIEDIENIKEEIMSSFSNYIDDQPELESYEITHEIFWEGDGVINEEPHVDLVQTFHRKEYLY